MRPEVAVVLGVVAVVDEVHRDELVGVVAGDRVLAPGGPVDEELAGVVLGGQAAPVDAVGDGLVHLGVDEFVAVALVDEDVLGLDAGGLEALDDLEHQLAGRVGQGLPTGFILIADDVAGLEERPPGLDGVVGAGEFLHPARDGLP